MSETKYMISDAAKKIEVEPHVLRNWEEEIGLLIPRNEMGHRYYREEEIDLLKTIKHLKDQGFFLRAIKLILGDIEQVEKLDAQNLLKLRNELNEKVSELEEHEHKNSQNNQKINIKKEEPITSVESLAKEIRSEHQNVETAVKDTMLEDKQEEEKHPIIEHSIEIEQAVQDKMLQFEQIMNKLILNALKENNKLLSEAVGTSISESILKEMDYMMRMKEEREEERYKQIDETIRYIQKNRQEVASTLEDKTTKRSRFFFWKHKR